MTKKITYTHCTICEQGCGLAVESDGDKVLSIGPDMENPRWRDFCIKARRGEAHAGAGMLEDKTQLRAVQLGIGRHRGEPGVPDAVKQFEIMLRIFGGDGDTVAGHKMKFIAQGAGKPRGACRELAIGRDHARTGRGRR